jgi:hypothetical protein
MTTKTLHYTVAVEVDDHGQCLPGDIGEGIAHGISQVIDAGCLTRSEDVSTLVHRVTACFSHEEQSGSLSPEIHRVLFCSTAHLSAATNQRMLLGERIGPIYDDLAYGYLLRVPDDDEEASEDANALADDIRALLAKARAETCRYIRLDCDAGLLDGLPVHDW